MKIMYLTSSFLSTATGVFMLAGSVLLPINPSIRLMAVLATFVCAFLAWSFKCMADLEG